MTKILALSIILASSSCGTLSQAGPGIRTVLARVDVQRLIQCREAGPEFKQIAKCLGAEAASQGLQIAYDEAVRALEKVRDAGAPGSGAGDHAKAAAASELDAALDHLGAEIAATEGGAL